MTFIKKYWWVFALILGAILVYFFVFMDTPEDKKTPPDPSTCRSKVGQTVFDNRVAEVAAQIDEDPVWRASAIASKTGSETDNDAIQRKAYKYVTVNEGWCP